MKVIEKTGKTVDDAVVSALAELKATREEVEITILEAGSKGILGFGSKSAKVTVKLNFNPERIATDFLNEVSNEMGIDIEIETTLKDNNKLDINLKGKSIGILIGKHGRTLDSLQYLTNLVVNKGEEKFVTINLDAESYRTRRRETLETLAFNLCKKVKATKKGVVLEPMTSYERRIIHTVIQNDKYVSSHSEGIEPHRYIVISPRY